MKKISILFILSIVCFSGIASAATMSVVSDTSNEYYDGINWQPAVATWVHGSWPVISGATWIWNSYFITDPSQDEIVQFKKTFRLPACEAYTGSISITTDNEYSLNINSNLVVADNNWKSVENRDISSYLQSGINVIEITAKNRKCSDDGVIPCNVYRNPAGVIYSADISYDCEAEEVPEFTVIGAGLALLGAGLFIYRKQSK